MSKYVVYIYNSYLSVCHNVCSKITGVKIEANTDIYKTFLNYVFFSLMFEIAC